MVLRRTSLSDDLPMAEWMRLRNQEVNAGSGRRGPEVGLALPALRDDLSMADWQRSRDWQVRGGALAPDRATPSQPDYDDLVLRPGDPAARMVRLTASPTAPRPQSERKWEVGAAPSTTPRRPDPRPANPPSGLDQIRAAPNIRGAMAIGRLIEDVAKAGVHWIAGQGPEQPQASDPVARWAESQVGRGGYSMWFNSAPDARGRATDQLPPFFKGRGLTPKCNQFVWDAITAGGAPAGKLPDGRIPGANDWGDPHSKIPGYIPVTGAPQPGDVISNGDHVGIYSPLPGGRPGTVSAATPISRDGGFDGGVVHNDWGFRGDEGRLTIWRRAPAPAASKQ